MAFGTEALASTLAIGLLLSACQTYPGSLPDPEMEDDEAVAAFTSAGIPTTDSEGRVIAEAGAPAGPLSLTEDDVDRLVAVSNARAGVSGALLDDLIWRRAAATSEGRGWVAVCSLRPCSQLRITP